MWLPIRLILTFINIYLTISAIWKLEKGRETANNINEFKGNFIDNLELY
jgi:hypothetical protein